MVKLSRLGLALVLICLLAACSRPAERACECESSEEPTPAPLDEVLYTLPGLEHGLVQSPVNILSDDAIHGRHRVVLRYDHTAPHFIVNKGTTIELDFPEGGGSIAYDGRQYDLVQLHFHTPSEHLIDGVTYPMSMHIVNRARGETRDGAPPRYLAIAILFRMGEPSHFIDSFLEAVPSKPGDIQRLRPDVAYIEEFFPGRKMPHYFHYRGSLTTPPHTESVDWLVLKRVNEASPEQIQRINAIEGDNARHVQALYGRAVDD